MKSPFVLLLFLLCGVFTSFAAKSLIGYTNGSEQRALEIAEEEFQPEESRFLRIERRVEETAEEEFGPVEEAVPAGERLIARQISHGVER
ncbi:MAG: hypothetical protein ACREP8_01825 [Candidatus Binatia bacterium]